MAERKPLDPRVFRQADRARDRVVYEFRDDSLPQHSTRRVKETDDGYKYRDTRPLRYDPSRKRPKERVRKTLGDLEFDPYAEFGYRRDHVTPEDEAEFERAFSDKLLAKESKIVRGKYVKKPIAGVFVETVPFAGVPPSADALFGNYDVTIGDEDEFAGFPPQLKRVFRTNKHCTAVTKLLRPRLLKRKRGTELPTRSVDSFVAEMARHGMSHRTTHGAMWDPRVELLFQYTAILKDEDAQQVNAPLDKELETLSEKTVDQTVEARMLMHMYLKIDEAAAMEAKRARDPRRDDEMEEDDAPPLTDLEIYVMEEEDVAIEDPKKAAARKAKANDGKDKAMYKFESFRFSME
jgi:hypothetical protein